MIAGLFKAPKLLISIGENYLLKSTELGYAFISTTIMILMCVIYCLVVFFVVHFLFRSIWIALLGLNSVYPEGINIESTAGAGPKFWKKAKEELPNLSAYTQELDKKCSLIFSLVTSLIIMLVSISIIVLVVYFCFKALASVFPVVSDYAIPIGIGIYVVFIILSFAVQHLPKRYPESKRVEKFVDGYGTIMGNIFSLYFFKKPIGYINGILASNVTSKYAILWMALGGFFMGMMSGSETADNPIFRSFGASNYFSFNNRPDRFLAFNYENLRNNDVPIFAPVIQSDTIKNSYIKLFIPTIEREKVALKLPKISFIDKLKKSRKELDNIRSTFLPRYKEFNQIFINGTIITSPDAQFYTHPNKSERGILIYLPTEGLPKGKNLLEIKKDYYSKDKGQKIVTIPFYLE